MIGNLIKGIMYGILAMFVYLLLTQHPTELTQVIGKLLTGMMQAAVGLLNAVLSLNLGAK